jgi:cytosine/adenosine deaminase-related metal-dependent hydrolase
MSADFVALNLNRVNYAGAWNDPVAAVVFAHSRDVDLSVINGRIVVEDGKLTTMDLEPVLRRHNEISAAMIRGE